MKKFLNVTLNVFCYVIIIFAIVFAFIEARLLFAGDWLIYQSPFIGFLKYFLRLIFALYSIFICILQLSRNKVKFKNAEYLTFLGFVHLFIFSVFTLIFATNYVDVVVLTIFTITLLLKIFLRLNKTKNNFSLFKKE